MGLFTRGQPVQRLYVGEDRVSRVYLGDKLVWSDVALGVIGAVAATATAVMHPPLVTPGFGAATAVATSAMPAPAVSAHVTVTVPRAQVFVAMRAPDRPIVAPAVKMAANAAMLPPTFRNTETVSAVAMRTTAAMPIPVVGVAVAAAPMISSAAMPAPAPSGGALLLPPVATVSTSAAAPAYVVAVTPAAMAATATAMSPILTATAQVAGVVMVASASMRIPVVGVAVPSVVATASAAMTPPVATASSAVAAVSMAASVLARPPTVSTGATVTSVVATATTGAPAPAITTGVTYSDNFNRADGALGANWTTLTNAPVIATNASQGGTSGPNNAATVYGARWASAVTSDTQEVSCNVVNPIGTAALTVGGGILLRCNSSGDRVEAFVTNNSAHIFTRVSGTATQRAVQTGLTITSGTALRLTAIGNVYSLYLAGSGTPTTTWTDSGAVIAIGSGTRYVGEVLIGQKDIGGGASYGWAVDNWIGKDL